MKLIHKVKLNSYEPYPKTINLPKESRILHVDYQEKISTSDVSMWYEFDEVNKNELEPRVFYMRPTGQLFREGSKYIGSCVLMKGELVVHIYEEILEE